MNSWIASQHLLGIARRPVGAVFWIAGGEGEEDGRRRGYDDILVNAGLVKGLGRTRVFVEDGW